MIHIRKIITFSIIVFFFFIFVSAVSASTIFLEVEFSKSDETRLVDFYYSPENYETFFSGKGFGEYSVKIFDKETNELYSDVFGGLEFEIIINTETDVIIQKVDYINKSFRFFLPEDSYFINFYKNDDEILSVKLTDYICNNNRNCETSKGETEYLCTNDCGIKVTGPVCGNNICENGETVSSCSQDCVTRRETPIYLYVIVAVAIVSVLGFLIYKTRISR